MQRPRCAFAPTNPGRALGALPTLGAVTAPSLARRYAELTEHAPLRPAVDTAIRVLDIVLSGSLLLLLSPVWIAVGTLALVANGRPLFYRGERVGRAGQTFAMVKFRTLPADAESRLGPYYGEELTRRTQAEVTAFGRWLRTTQLDEIPQLWNVLGGDMSFVGPRPIRPRFFEELAADLPAYWQRLVVRPGLTGLAQTRMGREEAWAEKLAHDLEWVADRSVGLYLRTVVSTGVRVIRQSFRGASGRDQAHG
jgi:lipopolysaccharide/colanic/teichoic acid biosynthesis glycosyltransferase